ncbi:16S rRNA (cytidine(1402)-2'-O)-methyltransferase [Sediminibacillus dalangtanensis]|uniref:Ribosomal RNA small subunit methyltransferase I n=1 Tax=Sediminibacillus dalangtanensis TaxID=2729421 RepID=A0ABX7VWA4_9BACI|nr:16S rRNA (cytidine(1402)-2'-O)-methyltransferase [Sediminibacillus dalangtanensis]QTN01242.1 16S rRNA (cytidine(1402)-2'-O)-methyltransferase [Sediminibacillus dalangtanensis]
MNIQSSFQGTFSGGTLYLVPTPIGNLDDITLRALHTLKTVDFIAAEDTRNTKKLMNHFSIEKPLISYHEHNKQAREAGLLEKLQEGKDIALVSDAGMPAISDPGYEMVNAALECNLPVVTLPGANAALCALVGSGLSPREFYFYGFLPRKKKDREAELDLLKHVRATLLFYESPHRLKETLKSIGEQLGNRRVSLARELTKRYEEYIRGTAQEVLRWAEEKQIKGEFCIVVEGGTETAQADTDWWEDWTLKEHVAYYMEQGESSKDAIKQTAVDRKMPKRDVYQAFHVE